MIRIFEWDGEWYATLRGRTIVEKKPTMNAAILAVEEKGFRRFKQAMPPRKWFSGEEGPKPLKKALKIAAGVAKVIAEVEPALAPVAEILGLLADLSVKDLKKEIAKIDSLELLERLRKKESRGKNRAGVLDLVRSRKKALR